MGKNKIELVGFITNIIFVILGCILTFVYICAGRAAERITAGEYIIAIILWFDVVIRLTDRLE